MFSPGTVCLAVHIVGTVVAVGAVAVTDALTIMTKLRPKCMKVLVFFSPFLSMLVWGGFFLLAVSGSALLLVGRGDPGNPLFQFKMLLTGLVFVNGIIMTEYIVPRFERLVKNECYDLPPSLHRLAVGSATLSVLGWWGATFVAYFLIE